LFGAEELNEAMSFEKEYSTHLPYILELVIYSFKSD